MKYILYVFCIHLCLTGVAQQKKEKEVKVLLIGTFHFDNPGLDVAKFRDADILSPKRQQEVEEVTSLLKIFAPDKIFIEAIPARQPQIDSSFTSYKAGKKELSASEVFLFEGVAGNTLQKLGYKTDFIWSKNVTFSNDEINVFDKLNELLKQKAKQKQLPEDAEKRLMQDALINSIRKRLHDALNYNTEKIAV